MPTSKQALRIGDALGGLTAMLVALPSAIAFGLVVYSPLGAGHAAEGALAGVLGTIAIGLVAPLFGGAPRLISAPCAPAAAVLAGLSAELVRHGAGAIPLAAIPVLLSLTVLLAGTLQLLYGSAGGGRLIKYIPYPVVAGYLSGVGVLIILGQLPNLLGLAKGIGLLEGIRDPSLWKAPALVVGLVSAGVMAAAPRLLRAVPGPIVALACAFAAYFTLARWWPELGSLAGNPLVVGPIESGGSGTVAEFLRERWSGLGGIHPEQLRLLLMPTLTLSVLLSIDTLKTCVVLDALTGTRHDSNRELVGQGLGNLAAALSGGMAGAGTMGATLVNLSGGGRTRRSGFLEGAFALLAYWLFGRYVAWVPLSALAGILLVVGFRMLDRQSLRLLRSRSTRFDFVVIGAVVLTAVTFNLMAAAGVGLSLAILLFLREQIRGSVVRRKASGNRMFSKKRRLPDEFAALERFGDRTAIFELQGSLFFGTADQLYNELEPYLMTSRYVILDLRRVQSVDFTAAHLLEQIEARIAAQRGYLLLADLPQSLPTGQDLRRYFDQVGLVRSQRQVKIFPALDDALSWAEDRILEEERIAHPHDRAPLTLGEIQFLQDLPAEALELVARCAVERTVAPGHKVFGQGDRGDEVFLIRKGTVRIELPLETGRTHHLATFARGDFFGDLAFLDHDTRSANALACGQIHLYVISRASFDRVLAPFPQYSSLILSRIARTLAIRLRQTDIELRGLAEA